jgi:3-deoxy-D-manno-octulosonic acid kinase
MTATAEFSESGTMRECIRKDAGGEILFDAAVAPQVDRDWFERDYWRRHDALRVLAGGRGGVAIIDTPAGECVLRHYHRGGLIAKLSADRYLWQGAARTRSFTEFRLLGQLRAMGLPAPAPVASRYRCHGLSYTADLITARIAGARTLAECLAQGDLDATLAEQVGALVARFHRAGVWHADLNAHNVLLAPDGLHLIDFDRGLLRPPAARWQAANLQRLRRSLLKEGAGTSDMAAFDQVLWQPLLRGYERALRAGSQA